MTPPLRIFCGKGGVGKTTLSLALGLQLAQRGEAVVVVTSHPLDELALSISLEGLRESQPKAAAHLFVVHIDPRDILAEFVAEQVPSRLVARAVLSSRIYHNLIEVAPGLKEIAFLTRLKQLAEERDRDGVRFQHLIWDAPATGHFLDTLGATQRFDRYLTGPFASRGKDLERFFERADLKVFPICTLEEMAVEETIDLCSQLRSSLGMKPAALVCNLVSPLVAQPSKKVDQLRKLPHPADQRPEILEAVLGRHRVEKRNFERLQAELDTPVCLIERVLANSSDLKLLLELGKQIRKSKTFLDGA